MIIGWLKSLHEIGTCCKLALNSVPISLGHVCFQWNGIWMNMDEYGCIWKWGIPWYTKWPFHRDKFTIFHHQTWGLAMGSHGYLLSGAIWSRRPAPASKMLTASASGAAICISSAGSMVAHGFILPIEKTASWATEFWTNPCSCISDTRWSRARSKDDTSSAPFGRCPTGTSGGKTSLCWRTSFFLLNSYAIDDIKHYEIIIRSLICELNIYFFKPLFDHTTFLCTVCASSSSTWSRKRPEGWYSTGHMWTWTAKSRKHRTGKTRTWIEEFKSSRRSEKHII